MKKRIIKTFLSSTIILSSFSIISTNTFINLQTNMFKANAEESLDNVLKSVKEKIAKDSRVNLFDIKATKEGNNIILTGKVLDENQKKEIIATFKNMENVKDNIQVFPFIQETGEKYYGIVNLPIMQIRDNPKHSAQLITQGLFGMGMKIIGTNPEKNDWIQISMDDDKYVGWVKKADVWFVDKNSYIDWLESNKIMITDATINLLNSTNINDKSGIKLYLTTRIRLVGEKGDFYQVKLTGGNKYYSNHDFFVPKSSARFIGKRLLPLNVSGKDIAEKGKMLFSTPYLWGGASPNMTDCSGFTQMLYKLNGYSLPRDADQQQNFAKPINSMNDLKSGDLVFFAENKGKKASHVGIYLGDKKFIHSSVGYGGVAITSFDPKDELFNDWYIENYIGAGRIIK